VTGELADVVGVEVQQFGDVSGGQDGRQAVKDVGARRPPSVFVRHYAPIPPQSRLAHGRAAMCVGKGESDLGVWPWPASLTTAWSTEGGSSMAIDEKRYDGRVMRITELVVGDEAVIDGFTFTGCHFEGPAVLVLRDTVLTNCDLGGPTPEAVLWEIPTSRDVPIGAILAVNCHFERCTFRGIGFAGPPDFISQIRADMAD
jgi:hypothetical protein